mmetsp:Transcript_74250/g.198069  ORF Transcript_74250/g.198069 Transcript_74250/m.198069 type:complete len:449 (+) Transcript_74250:20-1366(+)
MLLQRPFASLATRRPFARCNVTSLRAARKPSRTRSYVTHSDGAGEVPQPSNHQMRVYALACAVPMVGFGFMDNMVMIQVGDLVDTTIGVAFGLTTLTAAAFGQMASDFSGVCFGGAVEALFVKLGLPQPTITAAQAQLPRVRLVRTASMTVGVVLGCALGMVSLLFMDLGKAERMKKQEELQTLFRTVMDQGQRLMKTERMTLYIRDPDGVHLWTMSRRIKITEEQHQAAWRYLLQNLSDPSEAAATSDPPAKSAPALSRVDSIKADVATRGHLVRSLMMCGWTQVEAEHLCPQHDTFTYDEYVEFLDSRLQEESVQVPLRRGGTKDTAIQNGEVVICEDIYKDPRYMNNRFGDMFSGARTQSIMVAPIKNSKGAVIGIIEMINKLTSDGEITIFTDDDQAVVDLLCKHCATFITVCEADPTEGANLAEMLATEQMHAALRSQTSVFA